MYVNACLPVLLLACVSCQTAKLSKAMNVTVGSFRVAAQTTKYEYKSVVGDERTFVYGNVSVENDGPIAKTFDLDALRLSFDDIASRGAAVDTVASVLPSITIDGWTTIRREVYWVFDGRVPLSKPNEVHVLYMRVRGQ